MRVKFSQAVMSAMITESDVECPVCLEVYNEPIRLPCNCRPICKQHVQVMLMENSLREPPSIQLKNFQPPSDDFDDQSSESKRGQNCLSISCPMCRKRTVIPVGSNAADSFPRDRTMADNVAKVLGQKPICENECQNAATIECKVHDCCDDPSRCCAGL